MGLRPKKSVNKLQQKKTADQHADGNPKMNVGEHDRHPAACLIRSAVLFHPDSADAPESRTPGGFAAVDTIGKKRNHVTRKELSLAMIHGEHGPRSSTSFSFWKKIQKLGNGRPVGTRTHIFSRPPAHSPLGASAVSAGTMTGRLQ